MDIHKLCFGMFKGSKFCWELAPAFLGILTITFLLIAVTRGAEQPRTVPYARNRLVAVPDILTAGNPIKLTFTDGVFRLPARLAFAEKHVEIDSGVKALLKDVLIVNTGGDATISVDVADEFNAPELEPSESEILKSPEAFRLELRTNKALIVGRTREGALRGIATLILLAKRARFTRDLALPGMVMYDAPRLPFRGWTHNIGPLSEKDIKRTIDVGYLLRLNKVLIPLDSYSSPTVFPFESFPIGGKSFSKVKLIEIFDYARARGIEPIPYFSVYGRVLYLANAPRGKELFVDEAKVGGHDSRNLDVANPAALEVALKLQEEIIDTLKPQGFCIAMDEIHYANTVTSAAARAKHWKPSDWYVKAVQASYELFEKKGVKLYLWGDMLDPGSNGKYFDMTGPALIARLPKDMIVFDWKYDGSKDFNADLPSVRMFRDAGVTTIGATWFGPKGIARMAHAIDKHKRNGLLLTAWNDTSLEAMPAEFIRALALTAYYSWSPEDSDLSHLPFIPDALTEAAAYWTKVTFPVGPTSSLTANTGLMVGDELLKLMDLPKGTDSAFIATPFKNYRGVSFNVFKKEGKPAAVVAKGKDGGDSLITNGDFATGLSGWDIQTRGTGDGVFSENGALKIVRVVATSSISVQQDIRVDQGKEYVLRYRVRVSGPGSAKTWIYSGDNELKWDPLKTIAASDRETDWATKELPLPRNLGSVRLTFSVEGASSAAWFDDVSILDRGTQAGARNEEKPSIPVRGKAKVITFMHATGPHDILEDDMHKNTARFSKVSLGAYVINYSDGSSVDIPLAYRVNVVAVNDSALGRETDVGLFGKVGSVPFVNLPTFTWVNPYPQKEITSILVIPGNSAHSNLLVFGISIES
ncbi:MAG: family 20 glycosylhydrolase [Gammaproteobacteria bacterium]